MRVDKQLPSPYVRRIRTALVVLWTTRQKDHVMTALAQVGDRVRLTSLRRPGRLSGEFVIAGKVLSVETGCLYVAIDREKPGLSTPTFGPSRSSHRPSLTSWAPSSVTEMVTLGSAAKMAGT